MEQENQEVQVEKLSLFGDWGLFKTDKVALNNFVMEL